MSDKEKISEGICISDRGVDHCGYCTDTCEAAHFKLAIREVLDKSNVLPPNQSDKSNE